MPTARCAIPTHKPCHARCGLAMPTASLTMSTSSLLMPTASLGHAHHKPCSINSLPHLPQEEPCPISRYALPSECARPCRHAKSTHGSSWLFSALPKPTSRLMLCPPQHLLGLPQDVPGPPQNISRIWKTWSIYRACRSPWEIPQSPEDMPLSPVSTPQSSRDMPPPGQHATATSRCCQPPCQHTSISRGRPQLPITTPSADAPPPSADAATVISKCAAFT